eukprot:TRINITY_DN26546_c0_g1_i2.p2 TRINITY_DN26546_c0_g1~~TRINITY_DN26546_c0_g1_i2.p2  ORF type:complete len:211 (-),score=-0.29 TRINITY_DN26546_c0_g1_i2:1152-1784(-)
MTELSSYLRLYKKYTQQFKEKYEQKNTSLHLLDTNIQINHVQKKGFQKRRRVRLDGVCTRENKFKSIFKNGQKKKFMNNNLNTNFQTKLVFCQYVNTGKILKSEIFAFRFIKAIQFFRRSKIWKNRKINDVIIFCSTIFQCVQYLKLSCLHNFNMYVWQKFIGKNFIWLKQYQIQNKIKHYQKTKTKSDPKKIYCYIFWYNPQKFSQIEK